MQDFSLDTKDDNDRRSLMIAAGVLIVTLLWFVRQNQQSSSESITVNNNVLFEKSGNAILSSEPTSTTTALLLSADVERVGFIVVNESDSTMYLGYSATTSPSHYSYTLLAGAEHCDKTYTGVLSAVLAAGTGIARITRLIP